MLSFLPEVAAADKALGENKPKQALPELERALQVLDASMGPGNELSLLLHGR